MKLIQATWKNIKKGQRVVFDDGDVGIIKKISTTLLHHHTFMKIDYFTYSWGEIGIPTQKYFKHECVRTKLPFKIVNKK